MVRCDFSTPDKAHALAPTTTMHISNHLDGKGRSIVQLGHKKRESQCKICSRPEHVRPGSDADG